MTNLRLGFVPLSDCALLAVAEARGLFRRHGVDVALSREPSWANIRDKVAVGALDGAQMLAGMPLAVVAGVEQIARPLVAVCSLGLNGNAITVSARLWQRMMEADPAAMAAKPRGAGALRRIIEDGRRRGEPPLRFAVVYRYAMHNYELRHWLAAAGIDPDSDLHLTVVPPPRIVEALERGAIDGFCVGEPWSSLAVARGAGHIAISKYEIWNNSPEKVFAVAADFAEQHAESVQALLRALIEAAIWCDAPENRGELARLLAEPRYIGAPEPLLLDSLGGRMARNGDAAAIGLANSHVFHRHAANFPWTSHAAWILVQMLRWGQIDAGIDVLAMAGRVYRPDLYRTAARALGISTPLADTKREGEHSAPWYAPGTAGPIEMGSDRFFDGTRFDPARIVPYLERAAVRTRRLDLSALAKLNP